MKNLKKYKLYLWTQDLHFVNEILKLVLVRAGFLKDVISNFTATTYPKARQFVM